MNDENDLKYRTAGVFLYDIEQVINKKAQRIKLDDAIVSANNQFTYSVYNHRFAFLADFQFIMFMPLVHRNTLKFIGADLKRKYIIWYESEGQFSALHRESWEIQTWGMATGKLIEHYPVESPGNLINSKDMMKYSVYGQSKYDTSYKEGDYIFNDHSYSLLI
jgi:hypothetical protein